jgi:hypothetical protein
MAAIRLMGKNPGGWPGEDGLIYALIIGWSYLVAYLGIGMIVIGVLRRFAVVNLFASVLIHVLVILAGTGIPTVVQLMSIELRDAGYTLLQITNPFRSLYHLVDGGVPMEGSVLIKVVPAAAICVLLLNLRGVVRELLLVRLAPPTRVVEDEAELHPPPAAMPTNPWDEPAS